LLDEPTDGMQPSIIKDLARMLKEVSESQRHRQARRRGAHSATLSLIGLASPAIWTRLRILLDEVASEGKSAQGEGAAQMWLTREEGRLKLHHAGTIAGGGRLHQSTASVAISSSRAAVTLQGCRGVAATAPLEAAFGEELSVSAFAQQSCR
jgi:hypothetical protein